MKCNNNTITIKCSVLLLLIAILFINESMSEEASEPDDPGGGDNNNKGDANPNNENDNENDDASSQTEGSNTPDSSSSNSNSNDNNDANNQDAADDAACKQLAKPNSGDKLDIECIGMIRQRMLVVTTEWMVYDLPVESLASSINRLYLNGSKPIPIKQKWPNLFASSQFQGSYQRLYNCFTAVDKQGDYLLGTVPPDAQDYVGFTYDITNDQVKNGFRYSAQDHQVLISSNELSNFYSLNNGVNDQSPGLCLMRFLFVGSEEVMNSTAIIPETFNTFYPMCAVGSGQLSVQRGNDSSSSESKCEPLKWPVLKGFIAGGNFHLFGGDYLFTFPQDAYEHGDQPVNFASVPMGTFIHCNGDAAEPEVRDGQPVSNPVKWSLIIAAALLVLILILCCVLCLAREALFTGKSNHRTKGNTLGGHSSKHSNSKSKKSNFRSRGLVGPQLLTNLFKGDNHTARSGGHPSSRKLSIKSNKSTKKNNKTARSSAGKPKMSSLTAKPGSHKLTAKSNKSARSRGVSKGGTLTMTSKLKKPSSKKSNRTKMTKHIGVLSNKLDALATKRSNLSKQKCKQ